MIWIVFTGAKRRLFLVRWLVSNRGPTFFNDDRRFQYDDRPLTIATDSGIRRARLPYREESAHL